MKYSVKDVEWSFEKYSCTVLKNNKRIGVWDNKYGLQTINTKELKEIKKHIKHIDVYIRNLIEDELD